MSKSNYPGVNELETYLYASGLITPSTGSVRPQDVLDIGQALNAAIAEWERGTGWVPFLSGSASTRTFDPPGPEKGPVGFFVGVNNMGGSRKLFLNAGVRSITTLTVGVTLTNPGTVLTLNRDYWLRPQNATVYDRPYTWVEFTYPQWGNPQSITINAPWGFGTTVPDDVWSTVLRMAAIEVVPQLEMVLTGGEISVKLGNDEFKFNPQLFQRQVGMWQAQNDKICGRYKRKVTA